MVDFNPWGKSLFSAKDPADPTGPSLPQRKEGDTRSGWSGFFNRADKSYPAPSKEQPVYQGSQSQAPDKDQ